MWLGRVEGGSEGIIGGVVGLGSGVKGSGVGVGNGVGNGLDDWSEVHPIVGVFVAWGCTMVSRSIHIPKP